MLQVVRTVVLAVLVAGLVFAVYKLWLLERHKQEAKQDLAEVLHVQYGMFDVEEWKSLAADIFLKKVQSFETGA